MVINITDTVVGIAVGTRPEIIKMAPIIRFCKQNKIRLLLIHTGQHYSFEMDRIFFKELGLPEPSYNLEVGSGSHAKQTGLLLRRMEEVLMHEKLSILLVEGDTNSVLAGGLVAAKLNIPVGHVEAGLRSYDSEMPEEINRILVDHLSNFLFAPTDLAENILVKEGIPKEKIFVTGNTIVDAVYENLLLSRKNIHILPKFGIEEKQFFLLTLHRQENVDNPEKLQRVFMGLDLIYSQYSIPILYPIHPRTKKRVYQFGLKPPKGVVLCEPLGYLEFLHLLSKSRLVLTDSGGIQEEACILKIPCVTLRENTERPETLEVGSNILAGTDPSVMLMGVQKMLAKKNQWLNPFGDGKSGQRIVNIVLENLGT